jgi:hypothetical protein
MSVSQPEFVEIYRPKNLMQAHAIRIALEDAGIRVHIEGELLQSAVGELPLGWDTLPRIVVEESQVELARQIVERLDVQMANNLPEIEPDGVSRCLACGSEMSETETQCASCGWTFLAESSNDADDAEP